MGPTWVLPAPAGPHVGPTNIAVRVLTTDTVGFDNMSLPLMSAPDITLLKCILTKHSVKFRPLGQILDVKYSRYQHLHPLCCQISHSGDGGIIRNRFGIRTCMAVVSWSIQYHYINLVFLWNVKFTYLINFRQRYLCIKQHVKLIQIRHHVWNFALWN